MAAKVVVASYTDDLKNAVVRNISGRNVDIVSSYNIVEAVSRFSASAPNILILDIDGGVLPSRYISMLLDKYNLLIILTGKQPKKAFDFYAYGVKDYIIKPDDFDSADGHEFLTSVTERIKMFFKNTHSEHTPRHSGSFSSRGIRETANSRLSHKNEFVIAIASSTGGTEALNDILTVLPENLPPILIVQHMPKTFTKSFAKRLDNYTKLNVKEAENMEMVYPGNVYIAPGDVHMVLSRRSGQLVLECRDGGKVHGVRPSADVLFNSVAEVMHEKALGVILTGMGSDGARGLNFMRNNGARTLGQDEKSSVIYGMPKAAFDIGAVEKQVSLLQMPQKIVEMVENN